MKTILVTGSAGFIGANLVMRLLETPDQVGGDGGLTIVGLDNMNDYYDVSLKEYRLRKIEERFAEVSSKQAAESPSCPAESPSCPAATGHLAYTFVRGSIADRELVNRLFEEYHFDIVVNLAAQAGVRYSIENPDVYIESNIIGFYNILEACRRHPVEHLVYASSSSVYGGNKKVPFSVDDRVDNPVSLYAATKKSNELMAHCYSKLYDIPSTGLRFFTVYGPAGRPDMAYFGFTNKLLRGETIQIFNYGNCRRDFTYVDDIVEGIVRVMAKAPARTPDQVGSDGGVSSGSDVMPDSGRVMPDPDRASIPYAVYNIGGGQPENLLDFVNILQEELVAAGVLPQDFDFDAHKQLVPMQPGDVPTTYADSTALERDFGFTPRITLREGLRHFARWYKEYYG
jgi:nucleoside-diphosphate-sugar epimerase